MMTVPGGGHHHRKSDSGSGAAIAVGLVLGFVLLAVLVAAGLHAHGLRKQVRDMTTRLELADGGAAGVPLFVGATDAEGDDGLRMTRTSAEAYARARGYMPPKTPQSGADDKLDNDSVAGDDVAGDVY